MDSVAKVATVGRFFVDLGLVIATLVVCADLNHRHHNGTAHTPVVFQVYDLRSFGKTDSLHEFFNDNVIGKPLCATGVGGCAVGNIPQATFTSLLQTQTDCAIVANAVRAPACAECVDTHAVTIWAAGNLLADDTFSANAPAEVDQAKTLRVALEACIARTGGARTVYAGHSVNPWALLVFWCSLATVYSGVRLSLAFFGNEDGNLYLTVLTVAGIVAAATAFGVLSKNASSFAWYFGVGQLLLMCGIPFILTNHRGTPSGSVPAMFGIFTIAAAPCMSFITFAFHGWLEHDMLNFGASIVTLFFAVCLLDDICSVIWSNETQEKNAKHSHLHIFLVFFLAATVFLFCTVQLPVAPPDAKLSGTLLFSLLGAFLVVYTVTPSILFQMREKGPAQATVYKELAESTLRILFFAVMMYYANHGIKR